MAQLLLWLLFFRLRKEFAGYLLLRTCSTHAVFCRFISVIRGSNLHGLGISLRLLFCWLLIYLGFLLRHLESLSQRALIEDR